MVGIILIGIFMYGCIICSFCVKLGNKIFYKVGMKMKIVIVIDSMVYILK